MDKFNVLSLFNGMGCIWLALEEEGIKVDNRYSSEIEKYPNQANDVLYPDTIQLGDVRNVDVSKLKPIRLLAGGSPCQSFSFAGKRKGMSAIEKHDFKFPSKDEYKKYIQNEFNIFCTYKQYIKQKREEFDIIEKRHNIESIEILTLEHYIELKEQNFEFEGQSYLFWEYIRILTDIRKYNPDVLFLLENVMMGKKWQKVLTQAIGINPIQINSALVSSQNRERLYWTNIYTEQDGFFGDLKCMIQQPKDQGILLKDILEKPEDFESVEAFDKYMKKYFLSDKMLNYLNSRKANFNNGKINYKTETDIASCLNASAGLDISDNIIIDTSRKARCFTAGGNSGGLHSQMDLIVHNTMPRSSTTGKGGTGHLSRTDGKTYCLDTGNTNAIEIIKNDKCIMQINTSLESGGKQPYQQNRVYDENGISPALCANKSDLIISGTLRTHHDGNGFREVKSGKGATVPARAREDGSGQNVIMINDYIRRLTPRECGRLQTIPEDKLNILLNSGISDTQLYKMFGNGWTIKVISYILSHIKQKRQPKS